MEVQSTKVNLKVIHNYGKPPRQGKPCPEKADYNSSPLPISSGAFYEHGFTLIAKLISDYIHYKLWDDITYPFRYFNGATVEVYEYISNFIHALLNMCLLIHAGINVNLLLCTAECTKIINTMTMTNGILLTIILILRHVLWDVVNRNQ